MYIFVFCNSNNYKVDVFITIEELLEQTNMYAQRKIITQHINVETKSR
jgi:hypothetical protein